MKNLKIISFLTLMLISFGYGFTQQASEIKLTEFDRNISLKDQLAIINAGKDNPSKINPLQMDTRIVYEMNSEDETFGAANDKLQPVEEDKKDPHALPGVAIEQNPVVNMQSGGASNTQPVGITPEKAVNYQSEGGGSFQTQPENSVELIDYRSKQGGNKQPVGDIPKK